jgi:NADH-ubiquinone reductase complex 1 MLRQ subunit
MTARRHYSPLPPSNFKKDWLSDPSTYPIIVVLSFATVMAGSFIGYKVMYCNDVRVSSKAKGHVVRTWA